MIDLPIKDHLLPVSWRARPGDFVSLMSLYESNYLRLRQLLPQIDHLKAEYRSCVVGEAPLVLQVRELSPYTSTFVLTYVFDVGSASISDPDLLVRVYHDAGLAEVLACARWHRHDVLAAIKSQLYINLGDRWLRNMMLNKWLDYCLSIGYQHYWLVKD